MSTVTIAATGDIFMGRGVQATVDSYGPDYLFELVAPLLAGYDIVVGNLESPVSEMQVKGDPDRIIARPDSLDLLAAAGFNALALANNHIMDYGVPALRDTLVALAARGIGAAGAGLDEVSARRPLENVAGKSVALLSYYGMGKGGNLGRAAAGTHSGAFGENPGHNSGNMAHILADIAQACRVHEYVLVALHWGLSGMTAPMRHQVEMAHRIIDAGATVVLGTGPHVLQPVERYRHGVIAYSLGNFVFDFRVGQATTILQLVLVDGVVESADLIPLEMAATFRPVPLQPETDRERYDAVRSLVVDDLPVIVSDAAVLGRFMSHRITPAMVIKKLLYRGHGVYPLSFYFRCLWEMVVEKCVPAAWRNRVSR